MLALFLFFSVYGSSLSRKGKKEGKESCWFLFGVGFIHAEKFSGDNKRYFIGEVEKGPLKCPICCRVWDLSREHWPTLLLLPARLMRCCLLVLPVHSVVGSYSCTGALWHKGWVQWEGAAETKRQQYSLQTRGEELEVRHQCHRVSGLIIWKNTVSLTASGTHLHNHREAIWSLDIFSQNSSSDTSTHLKTSICYPSI